MRNCDRCAAAKVNGDVSTLKSFIYARYACETVNIAIVASAHVWKVSFHDWIIREIMSIFTRTEQSISLFDGPRYQTKISAHIYNIIISNLKSFSLITKSCNIMLTTVCQYYYALLHPPKSILRFINPAESRERIREWWWNRYTHSVYSIDIIYLGFNNN